MTVERYLRLIAGFFVMLSVALGYWVHPDWFLFTALCRAEPVPVGIHQLVPDDDVSAEAGSPAVLGPQELTFKRLPDWQTSQQRRGFSR